MISTPINTNTMANHIKRAPEDATGIFIHHGMHVYGYAKRATADTPSSYIWFERPPEDEFNEVINATSIVGGRIVLEMNLRQARVLHDLDIWMGGPVDGPRATLLCLGAALREPTSGVPEQAKVTCKINGIKYAELQAVPSRAS